jgi:hypothetical protein
MRSRGLEEHATGGGGGVNTLVEDDEGDTAGLEDFGDLNEVFQGAAEPVRLGDHELIASTRDQ